MNVCAVRTILQSGYEHAGAALEDDALPHEPKSEHRYMLNLVVPEGFPKGLIGDYAECKHCGCIYPSENQS